MSTTAAATRPTETGYRRRGTPVTNGSPPKGHNNNDNNNNKSYGSSASAPVMIVRILYECVPSRIYNMICAPYNTWTVKENIETKEEMRKKITADIARRTVYLFTSDILYI